MTDGNPRFVGKKVSTPVDVEPCWECIQAGAALEKCDDCEGGPERVELIRLKTGDDVAEFFICEGCGCNPCEHCLERDKMNASPSDLDEEAFLEQWKGCTCVLPSREQVVAAKKQEQSSTSSLRPKSGSKSSPPSRPRRIPLEFEAKLRLTDEEWSVVVRWFEVAQDSATDSLEDASESPEDVKDIQVELATIRKFRGQLERAVGATKVVEWSEHTNARAKASLKRQGFDLDRDDSTVAP